MRFFSPVVPAVALWSATPSAPASRPNQRFRMIQTGAGTGHAQHCPYLTEWRGRFKDGAGKWHTVEACDGHPG